ncbi:hypothetical protein FB45DRAFT_1035328 [Roridomyces roridus]|uniref:F-box domain-containing protein n=1 Tax=Roridomyces roridus TaxID=1738132 RepID=A0AAD7FEB9_9AGAR|nr:hypothetical protein FB45DRAFT_1035328 [Roridomyces roridus]
MSKMPHTQCRSVLESVMPAYTDVRQRDPPSAVPNRGHDDTIRRIDSRVVTGLCLPSARCYSIMGSSPSSTAKIPLPWDDAKSTTLSRLWYPDACVQSYGLLHLPNRTYCGHDGSSVPPVSLLPLLFTMTSRPSALALTGGHFVVDSLTSTRFSFLLRSRHAKASHAKASRYLTRVAGLEALAAMKPLYRDLHGGTFTTSVESVEDDPEKDSRQLTDVAVNSCFLSFILMLSEDRRSTIPDRSQHQSVRGELAAIPYPVLTLPTEITSEIFLHYTSDFETPRFGTLILASVCSSWREVALSTPRLWTRFDRAVSRTAEVDDIRMSSLLRAWIARSGKLPLNLCIGLPDGEHPEHANLLRVLVEHCSQWNALCLDCDGPLDIPVDFPGPLLALTTLRVQGVRGNTTIPRLPAAPCLREVLLHNARLVDTDWIASLPWSQLTTLRLQVHLSECSQILEHTPNLECLDLESEATEPTAPPISAPQILHHLHTMSIGDGFSYDGRPLTSHSPRAPQSSLPFHLLLPLEGVFDVQAMKAHLSVASTVQSLDCWGVSSPTFHELCHTLADNATLFPALTTLELSDCATDISLKPLARMLEARREESRAVKLASFKLSFDPDLSIDEEHYTVSYLVNAIRELHLNGLQLDIEKASVEWYSDRINPQMIDAICGRASSN